MERSSGPGARARPVNGFGTLFEHFLEAQLAYRRVDRALNSVRASLV